MKRIILMLTIFAFASCAYGGAEQATSQAKALFGKGQYSQGLDTLVQGLRDESITPLQRAYIIGSMAEFYDELVGDTHKASRFYQQVIKAQIPPEDPMKSRAQERLLKLESLKRKYSKQDAQLIKVRSTASYRNEPSKTAEQIELLQAIIQENADYYRLSEGYYYLGINYESMKEYKKAFEAFSKAAELKPAIDFYLPVAPGIRRAHQKWIRANITKTAWGTVGVLLALGTIVFYASRPWRWLRLRHVGICVAGVLLWVVLFGISYKWIGGNFTTTEHLVKEITVQEPAFIRGAPASPGSEIMGTLFVYGLIGVLGVCVFSIAASRIKHRMAALLLNLIAGVLIMSSVFTIFYLRHCKNSRFGSPTEGRMYYAKGGICFVLHDTEPFVLTNPKAYPNLILGHVADAEFVEWLKKYCPFDQDKK